MKLHIPTSLLTLVIGSMSFAAADSYYIFDSDTTRGDLTDAEWIDVSGCHVELGNVNGGTGSVEVDCVSTIHNGKESPASLKVNGDLVLKYDSTIQGNASTHDASLTANQISTDGIGLVTFSNANVQALEGDLIIKGIYYDKGDYSYSSVTNTNLVAKKGSIVFNCSKMYSGSISAANGKVDITHSTVTVNGLSAQAVNINEDGKLNIEDAGRVELGEVAVGAGASLGVNGATLVFNEESSITLAEGATLTAFDNVSFEFIIDTDSITAGDGTYSFDVFAGIDNLTDEASLTIIKELEQALVAGEINITLKDTDGKLIDQDAGEVKVSFTDSTISISGTVAAPEPTTATLSLLALAALAARRRRK